MLINRVMWSAILISFSHPCVEIDSLTDVVSGVGVDMLSDMETIMATAPAITGTFVVGGACVADALADVLTVDIDSLAGENVNDLAAVMTPLEFTLPAP